MNTQPLVHGSAIANALAKGDRFTTAMLAALCGVSTGAILVLAAVNLSTFAALGIMVGLVIGGAILLFPQLGFLAVAFVIPLERMGRFTDDQTATSISLMRFVGVIALGAFLIHAMIRGWKLRLGVAVVLYGIFCTFGAISLLFSSDQLGGIRTVGQCVGNLVFLFLVVNMVRNWKMARAAILIWLVASVLAGVYTIYGWHFGGDRVLGETSVGTTDERFQATYSDNSQWDGLDIVGRAMGPTSHPAVYGINLVLTLPFWFYLFRIERRLKPRLLISIAFLIIAYNIFLTNTRAAILAALLVCVLVAVRGLFPVRPGLLIPILMLCVPALYFIPGDIYKRVLDPTTYFSGSNTGTLQLRLRFWNAAVEIIRGNWLFGVGMGNQLAIPSVVEGVSPERISAHNEYLNMLIEVGVLGSLLMFATVAVVLAASFRAASLFRRMGKWDEYWFMVACQLNLVAALVYGIQVDVFHFPLKGWWLVAGICIPMLDVARRQFHREQFGSKLNSGTEK
jgi:O-Antigen ligase